MKTPIILIVLEVFWGSYLQANVMQTNLHSRQLDAKEISYTHIAQFFVHI